MVWLPTWCRKDKTLACFIVILLAFSSAYILAVCKLCCVDEGRVYSFLIDDVMIGMRYAYNLAHGYGLVWNPGERIQGYTNLGWTLFSALVHWLNLPINLNSLVIQLVNGILHLLLITYWFRILRGSYGGLVALACAAIMAFNVSIFIFSLQGYETTIICLLASLAFSWCIVGPKNELGITRINFCAPLLTALCALIRADSSVLFGSSVLVTIVGALLVKATKRQWAIVLASVLSGMAAICLMLIWQKYYYGDFLPNTFYLKCNPSVTTVLEGLKYFSNFALRDWQIGYLAGTIGFLVKGLMDTKTRSNYWPLFFTLTPSWLYIIGVGGDCFGLGRFFTPLLPMMIVCSVLFFRDTFGRQISFTFSDGRINWQSRRVQDERLEFAGDAFALLLAYSVLSFPFVMVRALNTTKLLNMDTITTVRTLRAMNLKPGTLIGVFRAGSVPYYLPEFRFHDFLGKCDTHISHLQAHEGQLVGHNKFDYQYSLGKLKPEVVISSHPLDSKFRSRLRQDPSNRNYLETLYYDDDFIRYYLNNFVLVPVTNKAADIMWVYRRSSSSDHNEIGQPRSN
ncbi:MAG: hypothetical protein C5B53_01555 [Candidatus Melainabacteria bacterium]|nr:MAG: hypothetical protein C5B53_01555 [Candidatus Melainabacteria bacterium]